MKECKHEWYVFNKTVMDRSLSVECRKCKMYGFVENPSKEEWKTAMSAQEPYLWEDNSRVNLWSFPDDN